MVGIVTDLMEKKRQDRVRLGLWNPNDTPGEPYHPMDTFQFIKPGVEDEETNRG
jgi:hypothetical protein